VPAIRSGNAAPASFGSLEPIGDQACASMPGAVADSTFKVGDRARKLATCSNGTSGQR